MEATSLASVMQVLVMVLFGGGAGLPLGVPPLPEDPLLARVAPAECLFYAAWSGIADPDPDSGNPTEQLLAEPELRHMLQELDRHVMTAFMGVAEHERDEQAKLLALSIPKLVRTLLPRPTAMFVSDLRPRPDGLDLHAGMLVNAGDDVAEIRAILERVQREANHLEVKTVEIADGSFYQIQPAGDAPLITWGTRGKYLVLGLGEGTVEAIFQRARTEPPQWLADVQRRLPVARRSTVSYWNLEKAIDRAGPLAGPPLPQMIEALGLGNLRSFSSVTGLDDSGFTSRSLVGLDGEPRGLLKALIGQPLTAADLETIPQDAPLAGALRLNLAPLLDSGLEAVRNIEPQAAKNIEEGLEQIGAAVGVSIREELLASLGDVWTLHASPTEGGLLTGWTATVQLRDRRGFDDAHQRLLDAVRANLDDGFSDDQPRIKASRFAGHTLHCLVISEPRMPVTPSWCLTDKHLVMGLYPQAVKGFLQRDAAAKSIAERPEVARLLDGENGPLSVSYADTQKLFHAAYPFLQVFAQFAVNRARQQGVDVDMTLLPSAGSIGKHLRPSVSALRRTDQGLEMVTYQSLPGGSVGASAPLAVALLLPAVRASREAARRMQASNNLKQIGLAMHNFHDVYRGFPAAYNTDKEGNPLLSWRVKILPFIEQQALYEQFRMDEPWDSEHNKALIPRIPPVYQAPGSKLEVGKTNYLGVYGKDMVFVAPKPADHGKPQALGISFASIIDGTSNTIMVVEANDEAAVIWTKPDDFEPNAADPFRGLRGSRPGGFQALFCDASVHFLSEALDPEMLRRLFTRNDGQPVQLNP